jgi:uncharacterized membrane protein
MKPKVGEIISDAVSKVVRTWTFVICQLIFVGLWIFINYKTRFVWDPYPFQFLKHTLTIESFVIASMILMTQTRQSKLDRSVVYHDYLTDKIMQKDIKQIKTLLEDNAKRLDELEKKINKES